MEQVAHQLEFAVDGVVNADDIFANVGRLRDGRDVLVSAEVRGREGARVYFEDRVLVDQICGNYAARERLTLGQTVCLVDRDFVWVGGVRNNWGRTTRGHVISQRRAQRREVIGLDGIHRGGRTALDQPAPLFIHKEEGSLAGVVVDVRNEERATDVSAGFVQAELGPGLPSQLGEIVVGVIIFVAVEVVERPVKIMGSRLDHHEDGSTGANSVVGRVVAVERLELSQSIDRRQGAEAATAAAIVQLSSVEHVEVVGTASSVETDSVGRGQSRHAAERWKGVRDTKAEGSKRG